MLTCKGGAHVVQGVHMLTCTGVHMLTCKGGAHVNVYRVHMLT